MIPENRRPCFCILLARGSAGPKKNHPTNTKTQKSHTHALGRCHGCYCWSVRLLARGSAGPKKNHPTNTKTQKSHTHTRTWSLPRLLLLVCTTTGKGVCLPKEKPSDQYQDTIVTHTRTWSLPRLPLLVRTTTGMGVCLPKEKPSDQYQDTIVTHALGCCHGCYCWSVRLLARGAAW